MTAAAPARCRRLDPGHDDAATRERARKLGA